MSGAPTARLRRATSVGLGTSTLDGTTSMARVRFTENIQRHVECPEADVDGTTVAEALDRYFDASPRARGYVLDEQGAVRQHMIIFLNGRPVTDRAGLSDALQSDDVIDVMQALSGG